MLPNKPATCSLHLTTSCPCLAAGWYTAAALCHNLAPHNAARASLGAALPRVQQLFVDARCMERRLRPWLPLVELARLKQSRGTLEDWLHQGAVLGAQPGRAESVVAPRIVA